MALEKQFVFKGVSCDYWRIEKVDNFYVSPSSGADMVSRAHAVIVLYVDKQTRNANVQNHLMSKTYIFPHRVKTGPEKTDFIDYMPVNGSREAIYNVLKVLPEFEGAHDD